MEIITVAIQRGGTGKTTTASALAQAAAYRGRRVLAIDLDPQGNLSLANGADTAKQGSFELITGTADARQLVQRAPTGIDVIPASWNLSTLTTKPGSARRLQRALMPIKEEFDFCFIDCPPAAGELQFNAMQAADRLLIPLQADTFSLQGLYQAADTAQQVQRTNPGLTVAGILFTKHNDRTTITRQLRESIEREAAAMGIPSLGAIRQGIAVQEAQTLQQNLFTYAPNSKPAQDYLTLIDKLI